MSNHREPLILAIETATRAGSVSLVRGSVVLDSVSGDASFSHSNDLIENVAQVLGNANTALRDVDLLAAASGPGSFTGLRIGLATLKAFAACTGRKCVGVSTLTAIAHAVGPSKAPTVALLPAGRGEVFAQMFSVGNRSVEAVDAAAHITPAALLAKYGRLMDLIWAGEGAHLQLENLRDWAETHSIAFGVKGTHDFEQEPGGWFVAARTEQLAISIAALALVDYKKGDVVSPDELEAAYVRASDAEINERWQQKM